ncbi:MAG: hypothetical protein Q7V14_04975 [Coriobacteriia bacterium]|nr:hypothetical protein [Coriobacteriia bacterium]
MGFFDRFRSQAQSSETPDDVLFMTWVAGEDSCPVCSALDGATLLPDTHVHPPHPECQHPRGCQCLEVLVLADGTYTRDPDLERLIRASGGVISAKAHAEYDAQLRAASPASQAHEIQSQAAEAALRAAEAEGSGALDIAVDLYRECIRLTHEAARLIPDDTFRFRDFPYLYDRLSLVLERLKLYEDGLLVLREYESLGLAPIDSMHKRAIRIAKRLGSDVRNGD